MVEHAHGDVFGPTKRRGLPTNADSVASKHLRHKAKKYLRKARAERNAHGIPQPDGEEDMWGVGLWSGASVIPGSIRKISATTIDAIELPERKPRQAHRSQSVVTSIRAETMRMNMMDDADSPS